MTTYSLSAKIAKGAIMVVDAKTGTTLNVIKLQYNSENVSRSYDIQTLGESNGGQAVRYKGPAIETFTIDAEIDATDQLESPDDHQAVVEHGVQPQLALLESLINPTSDQLNNNNRLINAGSLEIIPMEAPMALFMWSKNRIVPVSISSFSITEEAFDIQLNPIRAKFNLAMKVLSVSELGFNHRGGSLFMNYLQNKERLAAKVTGL